jgi:GT2 family glycosyltransferase
MEKKFRFVVATRVSKELFATHTALGKSLFIYRYPFVEVDLYDTNSRGLPEIYNESIERAKDDPVILIFAHDDIYLTDFFWPDRILNGLSLFEICGLAGNKRRLPGQPAWAFVNDKGKWDQSENLTGVVGGGLGFPSVNISYFGPPFQEAKLLDGVLLAVRSEMLHAKGLRFDPRFNFHLYDNDFCRSAEQLGIKMGTIDLSLVHQSSGAYFTESWYKNFDKYLEKWGE